MEKIRWGTIIPLIGGMAIGNRDAFNSDPEWAVSFEGFEVNEAPFEKYFSSVPFYRHHFSNDFGFNFLVENQGTIDLSFLEHVDVVTTVCPCAGLSMLNCANTGVKARGCNALQNGWIYLTTRSILEHVTPRVLMGENAPGLFTSAGKGVRDELKKIADYYGYSLSFIKVNTYNHGIPQNRIRTFYFFWDSETAPALVMIRPDGPELLWKYLEQIPTDATQQIEINPKLMNNLTVKYMQYKENDWRQALLDHERHAWAYIIQNGLFDDFRKYCDKAYVECYEGVGEKDAQKYIDRSYYIESKLKINPDTGKTYGGYWNDSVLYYGSDYINAIIGKNVHLAVHPTEDRSFTIRELLWMMGHPHDFEIIDTKKIHIIFQNVPACTARHWSSEVAAYLRGDRSLTSHRVITQDFSRTK